MKGILQEKGQQAEKHIKWDEETIAEHDKLRGQYPKITEPKTPYHYEDNGQPQEKKQKIDIEELNRKLLAMSEGKEDEQNEEELNEEQQQKSKMFIQEKDFQQKRKQHYNEFRTIKNFRDQDDDL